MGLLAVRGGGGGSRRGFSPARGSRCRLRLAGSPAERWPLRFGLCCGVGVGGAAGLAFVVGAEAEGAAGFVAAFVGGGEGSGVGAAVGDWVEMVGGWGHWVWPDQCLVDFFFADVAPDSWWCEYAGAAASVCGICGAAHAGLPSSLVVLCWYRVPCVVCRWFCGCLWWRAVELGGCVCRSGWGWGWGGGAGCW